MKRVCWLTIGMMFAALTLEAATYDASTGYVTLKLSGTGPNDSPLNFQNGIDSNGSAFWSDEQAMHAGTNYYFGVFGRTPYGGLIKDNGTNVLNIVTPANKIVLGNTFNLKTFSPYRLTFSNEGLFCLGGSVWLLNDGSMSPFIMDGLVTLQGTTSSSAFQIRPYNDRSGQTIQLDGKVKTTAATDCLYVSRSSLYYGTVKLLGDMTEFAGTVNVVSNRLCLGNSGLDHPTAILQLSNEAELCLEGTNGATVGVTQVKLNTRSRITVPARNDLQIGTFKVEAGTTLAFAIGTETNGTLTAQEVELPVTGTIGVQVSGDIAAFLGVGTRRVLLRAPAGTLSPELFALQTKHILGALPTLSLTVETEGDADVLSLVWDEIVQQIVSISSAGSAGEFPKATTWSNGKTPDENTGRDFYSPSSMALYFPGKSAPWTFPGRSFTKDGGVLTLQTAKEMTFSNFCVTAGTTLRTWPNGYNIYVSPLAFYGGTSQTRFIFGNQTKLEWRGPISGEVQIRPAIRQFGSDTTDWAPCYLYPSGDNSSFTGTWRVETESYSDGGRSTKPFTSFEDYYLGLIVSNQKNLGGPLPAFAYNALTLCPWQALVARTNAASEAATVTLDDTTRGINIIGTAQFFVEEGQTLAVKVPLTIEGAIKKKGTGTLALGCTGNPRFGQSKQWTAAELATANLTGTNVLWIAEGGLKPLAKEAADGLAIKVGPAGALRLDLVPSGDAATFGLYNTAWATPLVAVDTEGAVDASGKITVAFDLPETGIETKSYSVPVCTVSTAAAGALRGKFAFKSPAQNYDVRPVESADAAADTVTFIATVGPSGLMFIVR